MPALLIRMSTPPYAATVAATPALTCCSFVTSIATPRASPPADLISAAAPSAASRFRSAMTTFAPSRAYRCAMALPMPLTAPVTIATFPSSFMAEPFESTEVIVDDGAKPKRQIGNDVHAGNDFEYGQLRDRRERVLKQLQRRRSGPGTFHRDVLAEIADQFANARFSVDVRHDLQEKV